MHFFDLHCDTLYRALAEGKSLDDESLSVSFKKMCEFDLYIGCFAVWIPDNFRGEKALKLFDDAVDLLNEFIQKNSYEVSILKSKEDLEALTSFGKGHGVILTVEGGGILGGEIKNIDYLYKKGVKMITLTWNGSCEIGDGVGVKKPCGLSGFGYKAIALMEKLNIIIDLSHASQKLFYDVYEKAKSPFVVSHSNSQSVCKNPRNITDEQFEMIKQRKGLVGINFCQEFLNEKKEATYDEVRRHIEYFLERGGENILSFGSDFDGSSVPRDLSDICKLENLYEFFLIKNYNEEVLNKIFFKNAFDFIIKNTN